MKLRLAFLFFFVGFQHAYAQTDTAFWFAAPDISSSFSYDRPIVFRISSYQLACNVTVSQPANPGFAPITVNLPPYTTQTVDLTSQISNIECGPGDLIQNHGLKIKSDFSIAASYEVNVNGPNPELFSLKGKNSLGTQFYISSQNFLSNSNAYSVPPLSSFNIVASEDNTSVTISPSKNITGHAGGSTFVITLNRGQTYAAIASSQAASQHLDGSKVTSTKPIAITLADDLLEGGTTYGGGCQDLAGDQTVPISVIGTEYIAIRSQLYAPYDALNIIATQNNTTVMQDGILINTLNAGQSIQVFMSNTTSYLQTSAPVYIYQLAGSGCEVGAAILPKIDCTGSSSVSVARSSNENLYITLLVKSGGQGNFLINNASGVITASQFAVVPFTSNQWYWAKIFLPLASYPNGSVIKIDNTVSLFQMGFLQGSSLGLSFGYFSDFNSISANATASNYTPCVGSNITLNSTVVPSAVYSWTGPNGYISSSQSPVINAISTTQSGNYTVNVTVPGCGTYTGTVTINVISQVSSTVNQSVCQGQTYLGYGTTGTYLDHFTSAGGCDSARTLNLVVKPKSFTTINQAICDNQTYNGHTTTGNYIDTYVAANGCDSVVTLNLTVKPRSFLNLNQTICDGQSYQGHTTGGTYVSMLTAANGCDSVVTLNLTVKPRSFTTLNQTICAGQTYQGHTTTGTYITTLGAANGCDSVITLNLTVKPRSFTTLNQAICDNQSYNGHTATGTYTDTYVAANGCDSIVTLNLTVKPRSYTTLNQTICDNQSYNGHNITGTYSDTFVAANGCDSIVTLILNVKPRSFTTNNQAICEGMSYQGHTTSGTYLTTLSAANGCDSIITLNLVVKPRSFTTNNQTICEGQVYQGHTTSGSYATIFTAANGCDSIYTLNLTVNPKTYATISAAICEGQSYQGHTAAGNYMDIYTGSNGCDSIRTLTLSIKPKSYSTVSASICEGQSYAGHTAAGSYSDTYTAANGCDSIRTLNLLVKPKSYGAGSQTICEGGSYQGHTTSGIYVSTFTGVNGCDSIYTLNLTVKPKSFYTNTQSICEGQTYQGHSTTGVYITTFVAANGCDSIYTLNLIVNPKIYKTENHSICRGESYLGHQLAGNYSAVFTNAAGCDSVYTLHLIVNELPIIHATKSGDVNCAKTSTTLQASGATSYSWTPATTLNNPLSPSPVATPLATTLYYVVGTDINGCKNKDSVKVIKSSVSNAFDFIPNAFSPNGDGKNDCFGILNPGDVLTVDLMVYNRFGDMVFRTTKVNGCWDGNYKNKPAEEGAYVYYIKATTRCGVIEEKGNLILLR